MNAFPWAAVRFRRCPSLCFDGRVPSAQAVRANLNHIKEANEERQAIVKQLQSRSRTMAPQEKKEVFRLPRQRGPSQTDHVQSAVPLCAHVRCWRAGVDWPQAALRDWGCLCSRCRRSRGAYSAAVSLCGKGTVETAKTAKTEIAPRTRVVQISPGHSAILAPFGYTAGNTAA